MYYVLLHVQYCLCTCYLYVLSNIITCNVTYYTCNVSFPTCTCNVFNVKMNTCTCTMYCCLLVITTIQLFLFSFMSTLPMSCFSLVFSLILISVYQCMPCVVCWLLPLKGYVLFMPRPFTVPLWGPALLRLMSLKLHQVMLTS